MKMKALFLLTFVSFSSYGQNCHPGSGCQEAYSRIQALQELSRNESSIEDARGNLELVIQVSNQKGLTLKEGTYLFNETLRLAGGSTMTAEARSYYSKISHISRSEYEFKRNVKVLRNLLSEESSIGDAMGNLELINSTALSGLRFDEAQRVFSDTLRLAGGSTKTAEGRAIFSRLVEHSKYFNLSELSQTLTVITSHESSVEDALGNLDLLVPVALREKCSLSIVTADFLEALRMAGGSSMTAEARVLFNSLYGN
jgi:hypothetical protein